MGGKGLVIVTGSNRGTGAAGSVRSAAPAGLWQPFGQTRSSNLHRGVRFPAEVVEHAV